MVRKDTEDNQEAKFTISNGDLEALNRVKDQYLLKDGADVLTFALGILSQSGGRPVTVEEDDGSIKRLLPSDQLKKEATEGGE